MLVEEIVELKKAELDKEAEELFKEAALNNT